MNLLYYFDNYIYLYYTLLSGLGVSDEQCGIDINTTVIKIVNVKTIGPILCRVRRESRHKIKDDDQSPIKIIAPTPIVGILPKNI